MAYPKGDERNPCHHGEKSHHKENCCCWCCERWHGVLLCHVLHSASFVLATAFPLFLTTPHVFCHRSQIGVTVVAKFAPTKLMYSPSAKASVTLPNHWRPLKNFGWPRPISLLGPKEPNVDETLEASPEITFPKHGNSRSDASHTSHSKIVFV